MIAAGCGSWADYPYFGSEKFWFIEDNTIKGSGSANTSGDTDAWNGGRYVVRYNYVQDYSFGGHGTDRIWEIAACDDNQIYNNTFNWTIAARRSFPSLWQ